jgi:hypothetical protein
VGVKLGAMFFREPADGILVTVSAARRSGSAVEQES